MLETKNCIASQKSGTPEPTKTTLVLFGFHLKSQLNQTKPHVFYLVVQMTFSLKIDPNRTANIFNSGVWILVKKKKEFILYLLYFFKDIIYFFFTNTCYICIIEKDKYSLLQCKNTKYLLFIPIVLIKIS